MVREEVEYLEFLPTILHDIKEIKATAQVEKPILENEWFYVKQSLDNNFVQFTDEYGIKRFEGMLGIVARDTDDLETRRLHVLARMQEQAPYTNRVLVRILDNLLGVGNYMYTRDVANKNIDIKIELSVIRQIDILTETLERILPANMTYNITQRFNIHSYVRQFTHLELMNYTHKEIREDELLVGLETYNNLEPNTYDYLSSFTYNQIFRGEI